MKRTLTVLVVFVLAATLVAGCASSQSPRGAQIAVAGPPATTTTDGVVEVALPAAINGFGLDLLRRLREDGENTVISPLSVHAALSMTALGARSDTAEEMLRVLRLESLPAESGWSYPYLLGGLYEPRDITLAMANSLWAQEGAPFEQGFLDANRDYFGAEVRTLDLQAPEAADQINGWVAERTRDRITEIIDAPDPTAVLELVNAVSFQADWAEPFDENNTELLPFTLSNGDSVDVGTMQATREWAYGETDELQVVRIPYVNDRFAAYVLVPRDGLTPDEVLDTGQWSSITSGLEMREGFVALPHFELEWGAGTDLSEALAGMGMPSAFDPMTANFSGISREMAENGGLNISRVLHKTYVRVDETGTEAAAATDVEIVLRAAQASVDDFFEMRADRPFIYAIVDEASGALLFVGVIEDPRE